MVQLLDAAGRPQRSPIDLSRVCPTTVKVDKPIADPRGPAAVATAAPFA